MRTRLPAGFGFKQFEASFEGWEVVPLARGGEIIGGVLINGNEIHVGMVGSLGFLGRHYLKSTFLRLLRKHGTLKTAVSVDNERGLRFCTRLGFHEIGRANGLVFLRCEKSNYV